MSSWKMDKLFKIEKSKGRKILTIFNFIKIKYRRKKYKLNSSITELFKKYGYFKSIELDACVDGEGNAVPWYNYPVIEYLKQLDFSDKRIFEFGCGNSSIWWANRAKEVISVEHDLEWYTTRKSLEQQNLKLNLRQDEENYCNCILEQPGSFDVIIVDGIHRDACVDNALKKLSPNGMIIFDNTDRVSEFKEYKDGIVKLNQANLLQVDFIGIAPIIDYVTTTSIFFTREFNFKSAHEFQPSKSIGQISETEVIAK